MLFLRLDETLNSRLLLLFRTRRDRIEKLEVDFPQTSDIVVVY